MRHGHGNTSLKLTVSLHTGHESCEPSSVRQIYTTAQEKSLQDMQMIQSSEGTRLLARKSIDSPTVAHLVAKESAAADALLVERVLDCCPSDGCITSDVLLRYHCIKANATRPKGNCCRLGTVGSNLCSLRCVSQQIARLDATRRLLHKAGPSCI